MILLPLLTAWAGYSAYVYFWVFTAEDRGHWGREGFPSDARKWRAVIDPISDPDSVREKSPELFASPSFVRQRFADGEWVFGIATNSHEGELLFEIVPRRQGGTIVLKDSRGRLRVLYGHVCGPSFQWKLERFAGRNLDDFSSDLRRHYTEQSATP